MEKCGWCNLTEEEKRWMLSDREYWTVYLADEQDYIGRCILVLKRHCGSMSELLLTEWKELKQIIDKLEHCFKAILGAELCNWSCLMNSFYKDEIPNPHLHISVRPRYKNPVILNHKEYIDTEFGRHYRLGRGAALPKEDMQVLFELLKNSLMI